MNFSGTWRWRPEHSVMHGPAIKNMQLRLEHRDSVLTHHTSLTDSEGRQREQLVRYEIGAETVNMINGATVRSCASWVDDELLIESSMATPNGEVRFRDYWSISSDGRTLTMSHRDDGLAGQVAMFDKVPEPAVSGNNEK